MPRYEYKCGKCHRNFEVTHGINESVEECEYCSGPVRRVFHPVGIVFKGSGFYATDSRAGGGGSDRVKHQDEPHEAAAKAKSGDNGSKKDGDKGKGPAESSKSEST